MDLKILCLPNMDLECGPLQGDSTIFVADCISKNETW